MNKKKQAHESIERLFAEPFTPQWMAGQEEAELLALQEFVTNGVDQQWRRAAEESRQRIADKYPSKRRVRQGDGSHGRSGRRQRWPFGDLD